MQFSEHDEAVSVGGGWRYRYIQRDFRSKTSVTIIYHHRISLPGVAVDALDDILAEPGERGSSISLALPSPGPRSRELALFCYHRGVRTGLGPFRWLLAGKLVSS